MKDFYELTKKKNDEFRNLISIIIYTMWIGYVFIFSSIWCLLKKNEIGNGFWIPIFFTGVLFLFGITGCFLAREDFIHEKHRLNKGSRLLVKKYPKEVILNREFMNRIWNMNYGGFCLIAIDHKKRFEKLVEWMKAVELMLNLARTFRFKAMYAYYLSYIYESVDYYQLANRGY